MITFIPSSKPTAAVPGLPVLPGDPAAVDATADTAPASPGAVFAQPRLHKLQREQLLAEPQRLHPALWRAHSSGLRSRAGLASGFAALDAELPDRGWPSRALTELLLPRPGVGEIRLLAPALGEIARSGRCLMLFDPPEQACAAALSQLGIQVQQCIVVRSAATASAAPVRRSRSAVRLPGADLCWALEQALRSGQVGAVLAWPGAGLQPEALRRLQLAAQAHEGPAFVLRPLEAAAHPSPAPLRLSLQAGGPDELVLSLVKRRGPASAEPLRLALPPVLSERARSRVRVRATEAADPTHRPAAATPLSTPPPTPVRRGPAAG